MTEFSIDELRRMVGKVPTGAIPAAWWITTESEQIAAYDRWVVDYDDHRHKIESLAATIGLTANDAFYMAYSDVSRLTGFAVPHGMNLWPSNKDHIPVPAGWRIDKKTDRLVPSRKTKADRESQANKDFAAVAKIPNVSAYMTGLPNEIYVENRDMGGTIYRTQYRRGDECVMAFSGGDPDRTPERKRWDTTDVDANTWHRQRISVLVALREEQAA